MSGAVPRPSHAAEAVKSCCAELYSSDVAKMLIGESFHPGGIELTGRLGELMELSAQHHVLDVASGLGSSAIYLAQRFSCRVTGVDLSARNVERATEAAATAGISDRVCFWKGDAERLPFPDACFDAVVCECAFCTFPDKPTAASEMTRVLRHGGLVGISDLTRNRGLPQDLSGLLAWIACVGDAGSVDSYRQHLTGAGLGTVLVENHDQALVDMVEGIRMKLMAASLMVALGEIDWVGGGWKSARDMAAAALREVKQGNLGYSILVATRG